MNETEAVLNPTSKVRPVMNRRRRLGLFGWHLRVAFGHLWSIMRGR